LVTLGANNIVGNSGQQIQLIQTGNSFNGNGQQIITLGSVGNGEQKTEQGQQQQQQQGGLVIQNADGSSQIVQLLSPNNAGQGAVIMIPTSMAGGGGAHVIKQAPDVPDEEPLYVNAKQYNRILKRRKARGKLEAAGLLPKERKKYLHESRHKHAMNRCRGEGGRFHSNLPPLEGDSNSQSDYNSTGRPLRHPEVPIAMSTRAPQQHATLLTHDQATHDAAQEAAQYATTLSNLQPGQIIRTSSGQTFQLADASAMGMVGANGASFVTLQEVPSTKTEVTVADGQELSVARTVTLSTAE